MNWSNYLAFAIPTIGCWLIPTIICVKKKRVISSLYLLGIIMYTLFIVSLWYSQGYPPLRTMNDTRLWYSLFIAFIGLTIYIRWHYRWLLSFTGILASLFVCITISKPKQETIDLFPVLQSIWFIPHVLFYMLSYSLLLLSTIVGYYILYKQKRGQNMQELKKILESLISIGLVFLISGLLIGMLWANDAWGNFWSWDIKEIWALLTLFTYLLIYHLMLRKYNHITIVVLLSWGLVFFMITWMGIKYLPNTDSLHLYN